MEAIPLVEMFSAACAKALTFSWISRFGMPKMITSDCGLQFTSNLWSQLCSMLNIAHRQTTAYHPESNGAVERLPCRLKDALHACSAAATWADELPFVLLSLRAQPREDTGLSRAESVFGALIVLPNEFLQSDDLAVESVIKKFQKTLDAPAYSLPRQNSSSSTSLHLVSELPAELLSAHLVWVCRGSAVLPLQPLYDGPFTVICRSGRSFSLQVGSRKEIVAVSRLKACTAAPSSPRHRGQPPGKRPGAPPRPSGCRFHIPWPLDLQSRRRHKTVPEPFSYPAQRFLHAWDRRCHHCLHISGIRRVSGHCHRRNTHVCGHRHGGWTSDLLSSQLRPEFGGSPAETGFAALL
jgi:hypothetical protein